MASLVLSDAAWGRLRAFRVIGACLLWMLVPALNAQLPSARLLQIAPPGGKAGSEVLVTVAGTDLEELAALRFSHPGLRAEYRQSNRFAVTIGQDVPPGIHDAWVVGKFGASNPRAFAVGTWMELAEGRNSADAPQSIPLNSTVNGRTEATTVDYFRFAAKAAQRLLVRCEARDLDSRLEPVLALLDGEGRELARNRQAGLLDFTPTQDGELTLLLQDATYRGGPEYFYRLSVGAFPHLDYVQPLGRGSNGAIRFALFGRNLPGGQRVEPSRFPVLERLEVELSPNSRDVTRAMAVSSAQAALDLYEFRVRRDAAVSDTVLGRFPEAEVVVEAEPNNAFAQAQSVKVPGEISGTFAANGDRDWFQFEAKKGDVFWLEVVAQRLGQATDPLLLVQRMSTNGPVDELELNDSEANAGGTEFNTAHRDPAGRFEAKRDGRYLLHLRDLFSQPTRSTPIAYQLILRRAAPDFRLLAMPALPLPVNKDAKNIPIATTVLRRGETQPVKVVALRRDGFDGAIDLVAKDLPAGIHAAPGRIESGKSSSLLFLTADETAPVTNFTFALQGTSVLGGKEMRREAAYAGLIWNVGDPAADPVINRLQAGPMASVVEEIAPLRVSGLSAAPMEAVAGGKIKIPLRAGRDGEFTAPLKLKPVGVPALEAMKEFELDPKATNAVAEIDLAALKLGPGRYTFAWQGLATGKPMKPGKDGKKPAPKDVTFTLYSQPIQLVISAPKTNAPAK